MTDRRRTIDDVLAAREAELRAVPRLAVGDEVERDHVLTSEPVPGEVVVVGDDPAVGGGWVAVVRFWLEDRGRLSWEVVQPTTCWTGGRSRRRGGERKEAAGG
ncbi:hypothetical protein WMF27_32115 [Sorangium sp. So ce281]|uniref:hypothetical protein n=1 Tax=unclassified Sorangium TaxID=2621164 RepID=UPI003F6049CC